MKHKERFPAAAMRRADSRNRRSRRKEAHLNYGGKLEPPHVGSYVFARLAEGWMRQLLSRRRGKIMLACAITVSASDNLIASRDVTILPRVRMQIARAIINRTCDKTTVACGTIT